MTRNRGLPFAHEAVKVHTYWDTNVSDFDETLLVLDVETERERESTFFKIICSSSLPLRVPDERTDALHPIKILTRWTSGKIIIIVCLVALNINWRFHHLTIKSHYWIRWNTHIVILHYRSSHELAVFKQSKVERFSAVLLNLESLNKARSAGS